MAYKFYSGNFNSSGTLNVENAITGNSLAIDTGGMSVVGASSFQVVTGTVVTASTRFEVANVTLSSSGMLSGSNLVVSASAISASTVLAGTLTAPNLTLAGDLIVSGNTTLGDAGTDVVTLQGVLTGSAAARLNSGLTVSGGVGIILRNAADSADSFTVGTNGNVSGSGNRQIGGVLVVAGSSSLQQLTASSVSSSGILLVGGASTLQNVNALQLTGTAISASGPATIGGPLIASGVLHQFTGNVGLNNGLTVAGNATFSGDVTVKNLYVTGTVTSVSSSDLNVADSKIVIASGSTTTASFDTLDPAGLYIGGSGGNGNDAFGRISLNHNAGAWTWQVYASGAIDPALQVGAGANGSISIGSTLIATASGLFGGAITGSSTNGVGLKLRVREVNTNVLLDVHDYVVSVDTTAARTITLPSAVDIGRVYLIKDKTGNAATNNITIQRSGSDTIDGVTSVALQSPYAAVSVVCVSASAWALF